MHLVLMEIENRFKLIKHGGCSIDGFDENGNITMDLHECFPTLMTGYIITANKKAKKS